MTKPIHSWLTILEKFYDWWISTRNASLEYHHSLRFNPRNEALTESTRMFLFSTFPSRKVMAMVKHWKIFMATSRLFGERIRCSCRNLRFFGTVIQMKRFYLPTTLPETNSSPLKCHEPSLFHGLITCKFWGVYHTIDWSWDLPFS